MLVLFVLDAGTLLRFGTPPVLEYQFAVEQHTAGRLYDSFVWFSVNNQGWHIEGSSLQQYCIYLCIKRSLDCYDIVHV